MNIGLDIRMIGMKRTGDEVYMRYLLEAIRDQSKPPFHYYLFTDNPQWQEQDLLRDLPEHMTVICLLPAKKLIWTMYLLPRACHKFHIDLLHVMYITPQFFLPKTTHVVTTIHDISWKFVPEYIQWKDKLLLNLFIPPSIRKAHRILTVSKHAAESIHTIFQVSREKITAIYNGGFMDVYMQPLTLSKSVQKILETEYIAYLGSLQPRKNIPALIDGYAEYLTQYPESKLQLVIAGGKGHNYDTVIDQKITEYGLADKVVMPGFVTEDEKYALLKNAQGFFFLSLYEGFGIPAIEAMSLKTATVVSDLSCLPEVVSDGAITVDPDNLQDVAKAIYRVRHPGPKEKEIIEAGYLRAQEFSWDTMKQDTLQVYKDILINT